VLCNLGRAGPDGQVVHPYLHMLVCVLSPWELVEMATTGFSRGFVPKRGVVIANSGACGS
jgi:hypothetical protein